MAGGTETNADERRRWNDEYWASVWPRRERLTSAVTDILLEHARLAHGERVLDVGSGGGTATLAAGRLVGDGGSALGADISVPLVELARSRAAEQAATNVSFCVADVQHDTPPGAPFDIVLSQFGVMFFDEPNVAFANIHGLLAPGGRLAFACWQAIERNPWFPGPVLARHLPPPSPPAPGKSPTGPFSLSDAGRVAEILTSAGFSGILHHPRELLVSVERDALLDDGQLVFAGVPEASLDQARLDVRAHLESLGGDQGRIDAPLAFQIFTASR